MWVTSNAKLRLNLYLNVHNKENCRVSVSVKMGQGHAMHEGRYGN